MITEDRCRETLLLCSFIIGLHVCNSKIAWTIPNYGVWCKQKFSQSGSIIVQPCGLSWTDQSSGKSELNKWKCLGVLRPPLLHCFYIVLCRAAVRILCQ